MISFISLAPETIFHIGSFSVTNSLINTWLVAVFLIFIAWLIRKKIEDIPRGLQNLAESVLEFFFKYLDSVTHDRRKSEKFLPIVGTLFIFILISNWMGLLPGTGSVGFFELHGSQFVLVPLLRPATADLNTTLALSVLAIATTHIFGIILSSFFKHFNKFVNLLGVFKAVKTLSPVKIFVSFIHFFVGLIEIFSEIAKTISLALRLFGNIFAGEILLTVMASLAAFFIPLPFIFLELLVGFVQATIFAMLVLVFLEIASSEAH